MTEGARRFVRDVNRFLFLNDVPQRADILFVPGGCEAEHALRAAELYRQGIAPFVLPSGRYAAGSTCFEGPAESWRARYPQPFANEWDFLRRVCVDNGVPEAAVLREDQATYTWENARLSRLATDREGLRVRTAVLCCKPPHARRALLYYQAAFPEARFLVCPANIPGMMPEDWFLTPAGRALVLGEMRRLGGQIGEVFETMLGQ